MACSNKLKKMETHRLRIYFGKTGIAIFISGKNLQKIIERTLRRADAPLKYTEGFSPHPKISYGHPLPVGVSGENESFDVYLTEKIETRGFIDKSRELLPEGISFNSAEWISNEEPSINSMETYARYTLETNKELQEENLQKFGRTLETGKSRAVLLIKINNFSHKGLTELLIDGTLGSIGRKILREKENEKGI
jgi:radical SAM-linked protein